MEIKRCVSYGWIWKLEILPDDEVFSVLKSNEFSIYFLSESLKVGRRLCL